MAADPADAIRQAESEFDGLAILAREGRHTPSRLFWMDAIERLGQHVAADLPPAQQRARALEDQRGQAFAEALARSPL
jgi:hypothetical protein